jgi:hypothetical protein
MSLQHEHYTPTPWNKVPFELIKEIAKYPNECEWEYTTEYGNTVIAVRLQGVDPRGYRYDRVEFFYMEYD